MKLNIFTGLLFAILFTLGVNTNASAHGWGCCGWHHYAHCCGYHHGCCGHMDSKDKDKDNDKDAMTENNADKDKDKEDCHSCCHHGCGWGTCHSWEYVAPKHVECCHHECEKHECHHHDDCCGHGYYYRGGGR